MSVAPATSIRLRPRDTLELPNRTIALSRWCSAFQLASPVKPCFCVSVKNITISVDDDLYRRARIKAAESSTNVSALVKDYLREFTGGAAETEFERLAREEQELREELKVRRLGLDPAHNLGRDALHARHEIR